MLNKVCQLHSTTLGYTLIHKFSVEGVIWGVELTLHKYLTHDVVDKGRVYAVATEVAGATKI